MDDMTRYTHESYGMIGVSRAQTNTPKPLFGSPIKHSQTIILRIKRAEFDRGLHQEWFHGKESIIEIEMSAAQFGEFITSPNVSDGIPCTIRNIEGNRLESPPYFGVQEQFHDEMQEKFSEANKSAREFIIEARNMLSTKGAMKVQDKKILLGKLEALIRDINSNIPFLHKQFMRAMEKTVYTAKAEIESMWSNTINRLGRQALDNKKGMPLITNNGDENNV